MAERMNKDLVMDALKMAKVFGELSRPSVLHNAILHGKLLVKPSLNTLKFGTTARDDIRL
jgi:hypothetical protein